MASRCPPLASSGKISSPTAMSHGKLEYPFKTCVLRARKWPREARTGRRRTAGVGRTPGWTLDVHNVAVDIAERGGRITINLGSPAEGRPSIAERRSSWWGSGSSQGLVGAALCRACPAASSRGGFEYSRRSSPQPATLMATPPRGQGMRAPGTP